MRFRLVALVLAVALFGAVCPTFAGGIAVKGDADCETWVNARKDAQSGYLERYILGFMDGLAIASQTEFWAANGVSVSPDQVFLWLDNYCRENPLSQLNVAAIALMNEHTEDRFRQSVAR